MKKLLRRIQSIYLRSLGYRLVTERGYAMYVKGVRKHEYRTRFESGNTGNFVIFYEKEKKVLFSCLGEIPEFKDEFDYGRQQCHSCKAKHTYLNYVQVGGYGCDNCRYYAETLYENNNSS